MRGLILLLSVLSVGLGAARLFISYYTPRPKRPTWLKIATKALNVYFVILAVAIGIALLVLLYGVVVEVASNVS